MTRRADGDAVLLAPPKKNLTGDRAPLVRRVQRLLLATSGTPLRHVWALGYRVAAQLVAALLVRGQPGAAVYARSGYARSELLPGLSDIDLALVLATDEQADRVRRRWLRWQPWLGAAGLVDTPFMFSEPELRAISGRSALTFPGAAFGGRHARQDVQRTLVRPELEDAPPGWRPLRGPDRRPPFAHRDEQEERIAAWLELEYWWRFAFSACAAPPAPWLAPRCARLIAESSRIWLVLARGERADGADAALQLLLRHLPEEEAAVRAAIALRRDRHRLPDAPLGTAMAFLLRLSERIAAALTEQIAGAPVTEVVLTGTTGPPPPLADWRAVVVPEPADERLLPVDGDPSDPETLAAAGLDMPERTRRVLRSGSLLLLPTVELAPGRMRATHCQVTDPVSFALLDGAARARFPEVAGWSVGDMARRAVTEHAAELRDGEPGLGTLLSAVRAALLHDSVAAGAPELVLDPADAVARLPGDAAAEAAHHQRAGEPAPAAVVAALRRQVAALPAYALTAP